MAGYKYELTLGSLLKSSVQRNPNQEIVYSDKKRFTYSEFEKRVERLSKALIHMGLKEDDNVAVIDWDSYVFLEAFYAVPISGATLHTVNIRYPPELIYYTMQQAQDKFVIIRDEFVPMIEKFQEMFSFVKGWIIYSESGIIPKTTLPNVQNYDDILSKEYTEEFPALTEDRRATLFYTSGTTGMPKGVSFSHRQIVLHALVLAMNLGDEPGNIKSSDVMMPLVPMFHVHSWGMPQLILLKGMKYVLPGKYDFEKIPVIMNKEKVTVSAMVPSILNMILANPRSKELIGPLHLRTIIGGAALPEGLYLRAKEINIMSMTGYGMSETAPVLTLSSYNYEVLKLLEKDREAFNIRTGFPVPFVELRIIGKDGKDVEKDGKSIGEIVIRAPWATIGYYKDEEKTAELWKGGWLNTGDLAVMDNFGSLHIVDREKDAVKSGGEFIPTLIIEDALSTYPGIKEVAVVARPDPKWEERPVAFISGLIELNKN
ncbi:MAG: long-chain-fatty-acid--CoA ligase [Thermoplasmataceae archaeon]